MLIQENYDLTGHNTFGVSAKARFFVEINSEDDLKALLISPIFKDNPKLFLGGGSNILFTQDFPGIVVHDRIKGIETLEDNQDYVIIKSMGGEVWDDFVQFVVSRGWWGIENLALIPGTVGGAPVQNIGAYGRELKDSLVSVEVVDIETGEIKSILNKDCNFGYRDSIFKNEAKGKYFILGIILKLSKKENKNVEYKVLKQYLEDNKISPDTSKIISEAVSTIRRSKLPNPKVLGNAGSFFKNTVITKSEFDSIQVTYPEIPFFTDGDNIKIPTAWLVEHSGPEIGVSWKGYRIGNVGVHDKQALVLVNHGGATGVEIKNLANLIINSVHDKFGITLAPEVNLV